MHDTPVTELATILLDPVSEKVKALIRVQKALKTSGCRGQGSAGSRQCLPTGI